MGEQVRCVYYEFLRQNKCLEYAVGTGKSKTIEAMSCWAEKILCKDGDDPNKPRVLITAPTGKAASIVGK